MKTKYVITIIGIIFAGVFTIITPIVYAQCIYNDDWPDAPCFDTGPVSHLDFNKAWAPYYDHKGSEWMETKRIELHQVLEQGTIEEWVEKLENHNVYQYYLSRNEIQSSLPYDSFFVKYDPTFIPPEYISNETLIILFTLILTLITIVSFIMWRKRK
ncbi:MAG: hypothetical protein K5790_01720 [Nitrosopumilus sp.]|uniref:hypothetical protein n=1 Tax=Nitrosopumilus sp. TaxID=2024843 RepID=UPI00247CEA97|nr:hypothetical protein [Nitrosopumilus sp.]MCV0391992.1 hypothetical protein [Nitrosopumilus sp.]